MADQQLALALGRLRALFAPEPGEWRVTTQAGVCLCCVQLPRLYDLRGRAHAPRIERVCGPQTIGQYPAVRIRGRYPQVHGLRVDSWWYFDPSEEFLWADITLHNPRRAMHRGNLWDLGDPGSVWFRGLQVAVLSDCLNHGVHYQVEPGEPYRRAERCVQIYQDSSGGRHWDSANHVGHDGRVTCRFPGYRVWDGESVREGRRACPVVALVGEHCRAAAIVRGFWEEFPKAIEATPGQLVLGLFPTQAAVPFELQGGEQKTHRFWIHLGEDLPDRSAPPIRSLPQRWKGELSQDAYTTIPGLPPPAGDPQVLRELDALLDHFLHGPRGLYALREEVDEYGWRNFGDLFADHEELHYHGARPLISHYNNQFDVLCGFLLQWRRTGEDHWLDLADGLARHIIDIDIYHTDKDRSAYNGGLFWFTDHYLHAHTSTHRTFSRHNRRPGMPYGGGPGAEHNYTTGLLLYHRLTGYPLAAEAVRSLADWVLAMDDGTRTCWGLFDDGPTGRATLGGIGRAAANSINALLDGWLLTENSRYLEYAQILIHRCIHPELDLDGLDLLNAENHWSYTMFVVSLAKYLECKVRAGQVDAHYAYAQASLVHLGRWMLARERPYFDRKEELQYPTEAWPAQELRKANALRLAAMHTSGTSRQQMWDRGDALARRAWHDLQGCERPTTARAMAIVMTEGLRDAYLRQRPAIVFPQGPAPPRWEPWKPFVPQRQRIVQQLRSPRGVLSLVAHAAMPWCWPRVLQGT
jgi:hypothetical protein